MRASASMRGRSPSTSSMRQVPSSAASMMDCMVASSADLRCSASTTGVASRNPNTRQSLPSSLVYLALQS